jgi:hypothetical protein
MTATARASGLFVPANHEKVPDFVVSSGRQHIAHDTRAHIAARQICQW